MQGRLEQRNRNDTILQEISEGKNIITSIKERKGHWATTNT